METGHHIDIKNTAHFRHDYGSDQSDLRRLYEQAKIDQWNAARTSTGRCRSRATAG